MKARLWTIPVSLSRNASELRSSSAYTQNLQTGKKRKRTKRTARHYGQLKYQEIRSCGEPWVTYESNKFNNPYHQLLGTAYQASQVHRSTVLFLIFQSFREYFCKFLLTQNMVKITNLTERKSFSFLFCTMHHQTQQGKRNGPKNFTDNQETTPYARK